MGRTPEAPTWKFITAKRADRCELCAEPTAEGDPIVWWTEGRIVRHRSCHAEVTPTTVVRLPTVMPDDRRRLGFANKRGSTYRRRRRARTSTTT